MVHAADINECVEIIKKTKYKDLTADLNKRTIGSIAFDYLKTLKKIGKI